MVSRTEEYTSSSSRVFHKVVGEEENTVLSGGAKMKSSISTPSRIKTISILPGFFQPFILIIFFLIPAAKLQN
jgi:hypothetical protein